MTMTAVPPRELRLTLKVAMLILSSESTRETSATVPGLSSLRMISVGCSAEKRRAMSPMRRISMRPPPSEAASMSASAPFTPFRTSRAVFGWDWGMSPKAKEKSRPASLA